MAVNTQVQTKKSINREIFGNRSLILLWISDMVSTIGDTFFNIAVMWLVYDQSQSVFQSALVGVIWHLSSALFSPIAGVLADRWDRKKIIVVTNLLAAFTTGVTSFLFFLNKELPLPIAYLSIFLLNCLFTFINPARSSIIPDMVGKKLLATANGYFSTLKRSASLIGTSIAGFVIAVFSAGWAILGDAISFAIVAFVLFITKIPKRSVVVKEKSKRLWVFKDIVTGWKEINVSLMVKSIIWLSLLINLASFLGPLYPALVSEKLNAGPIVYGSIQGAGVVGGILGGIIIGAFERKFGGGIVIITGWLLAGGSTIAISLSNFYILTIIFNLFAVLGLTISAVAMNSMVIINIPDEYRGRVTGILTSFSVLAIPASTLIAGFLAELWGVAVLFCVGGIWITFIGLLTLVNSHLRKALLTTTYQSQ